MAKFRKGLRLGSERGISLISMAFMIMVVGLFAGAGAKLYDTWGQYKSSAVTDDNINTVQKAMAKYFAEHGRYPCPAPLDAAIDSPGFGYEVSTDCRDTAFPGTEQAVGRDGRKVRTGAVPVRTLGLADSYMVDGEKRRLIYAVTENYAVEGQVMRGDEGGIYVIDGNDNPATPTPGNIVQLVYSTGWDDNGAYTVDGVRLSVCDTSASAGPGAENCDYDANATFRNTVNKSKNANNVFANKMSYAPSKTAKECVDNYSGRGVPLKTTFLIDTSGSMGWAGKGSDGFEVKCPAAMPGCSRIDVARWAMRRVMPSIIQENTKLDQSGTTSLTGFLAHGSGVTTYSVDSQLSQNDITFYSPDELTKDNDGDGTVNRDDPDYINDKSNQLQSEIKNLCPGGGTPLGVHMKSLADQIGDGTSLRPNKITIISDGESNDGNGDGTGGKYDPVAAAKYVQENYPNVQIDVVDIVGNPSLMQIAQMTGGTYYRSDNPDDMWQDMCDSAGLCNCTSVTPPPDEHGCGSKGSW